MEISQEAKTILNKHQVELKNNICLPLFVDALVSGGITLFDEVRTVMENAGICLEDADFSKLK